MKFALSAALLLASVSFAPAGVFVADFDGVGDDAFSNIASVGGGGFVDGANQWLVLTNATNNQRGTAYVSDLGLSSGMIRASFSLNQSYGSGSTDQADGLSVYYGQFNNETTALFDGDLPVAGLRVRYHIENNAFSPVDESITVHYNGAQVFNQQVNLTTTPIDFKETDFSVSPAGLFNLAYDGNTIFQGMIAGWNPQPDWQFALTARTGGRNSQQFVDNLLLATPEPSRVALLGLGGVLFAARRRR